MNKPLKIAITGRTKTKRSQLIKEIEAAGHQYTKKVNNKIHLLVVGELPTPTPSGKLENSSKHGVRCIDENTLKAVLKDSSGYFIEVSSVYVTKNT